MQPNDYYSLATADSLAALTAKDMSAEQAVTAVFLLTTQDLLD